jgi:hypothetical protein
MQENLAALQVTLSAEQMTCLTEAGVRRPWYAAIRNPFRIASISP